MSSRIRSRYTFFDLLLFLHFFTLHADELRLNCFLGDHTLRLNHLITPLLAGIYFWHRRTTLLRIDRTLGFLLLFSLGTLLLSALCSPYASRAFLSVGWYGFILLFYFLFPYLLLREDKQQRVLSLYLLSFVCVGSYLLIQLLLSLVGIEDPFAGQRIFGSIVRPNAFCYEPSYYALYMTPFIVMANYHFLSAPEAPFFSWKRVSKGKLFFFNLFYFASTSTSAFFVFLLFCLTLPFLPEMRRHTKKYLLAAGLSFGFLALLSPFLMKTFFLKFFYEGVQHGSFSTRWQGIVTAWQFFLEKPWLGVGLGAYPSTLIEAWFSGATNIPLPLSPSEPLCQNAILVKHFDATNVFTELLVSVGILGNLPFVALFFLLLRRAKEAARFFPLPARGLLLAALLQLLVWQCNQTFLRTYLWTHLAITFALYDQMRLGEYQIDTPDYSGQKRKILISL